MTRRLLIVTFFTVQALTGAQEPTLVRAAAAEPLLPLAFERNDGQAPGQYRFLARRFAYDVGFGADRITVDWKDAAGSHVSLRFPGAHLEPPEGEGALPGTTNYVHGNDPSRWRLNVPTFERVRYAQLYDGVSAVFYVSDHQIEYDLTVSPQADPAQIRLSFDDAASVRVSAHGDLVVNAGGHELVQKRPHAYQQDGSHRRPVDASYRLQNGVVRLALGPYDRSVPLVVDPVVTSSTKFAADATSVQAVAVGPDGSSYIGYMTGTNNPDTWNLFVMKLRPDATTFDYSVSFGGSAHDAINALAVDSSGNLYVAGYTESDDFPTTSGAYSRSCNRGAGCNHTVAGDAFVTKITLHPVQISFSTYIGGSRGDGAQAIAVNAAGEAIITGGTYSADFPMTSGAAQQAYRGNGDGFVTKLAASGSSLVYSTYYGGSREEFPQALAVDGGGNAYVGGIVASSDLPTMSAFQPSHGGGTGNHYDGFVGKFSPSGSMLFSTYIGGNADDWLYGVTVNSKGLFAGGSTASTNFPGSTTSGGWITQLTPGGVFVQTALLHDAGWQALSADETPAVHAVGTGGLTLTVSPNAAQLKPAGPWSGAALYGIYPIDGSGVIGTPGYLTFFGGSSGAVPYEVAADGHGGAYFAGSGPAGYPLINRLQGSSVSGSGFLTHFVPDNQFVSADAQNVVAWARDATAVTGSWKMMVDPSAAGGRAVAQPDAGLAKVATPVANPAGYAELTFNAAAGGPYHLWLRGKAQNDSYNNDSAYVQFSDSNDSSGHPIWRIGTTSATPVLLEDCSNCGVHGWGWQDNGYGANVLGPDFYLATSGPHTIRFQNREDGFLIDEVLIASRDPHAPPDTPKDASRVLPPTIGAAPPGDSCSTGEVVLYASGAQAHGAWSAVADHTAAGGSRMVNPDRGAAKLAAPLASPSNYFEMSFTADAGVDYHLWLRGTAQNNYWGNDSVFVQFNDSVDASGQPALRVGTASGAAVNLEDCSGCGDSDWGWQDNGYGKGIMGPNVRFATSGLHTIRVQVREDGFSIDQIVLSAKTDIAASPGLLKGDRTILPQCANPPLR